MPNAVCKALERFQPPIPPSPQHSPHKWLASNYGTQVQYSPNATKAPKLDKRSITCVQSIASTFLYIARAVDPTMLVKFNDIGAEKASPTTNTIQKIKMLMEYAAT